MVDKRINQHIISALNEDQYQNDLTSKLSKNIEVQASII